MKFAFITVVLVACGLLGAAMVYVDSGTLMISAVCALGALIGFLVAYQMQAHYTFLDDE